MEKVSIIKHSWYQKQERNLSVIRIILYLVILYCSLYKFDENCRINVETKFRLGMCHILFVR